MLTFKDEAALIKFIMNADLPEWQKKLMKKNRDSIQVHSQGRLFYKIDRLFPNENPVSKQHRVLSFESITEASFGRAANNVNRIFKNSSYTVEASEKTIEVLSKKNYEGHDFYTWFLDQWTKWALKEDPNAIFVVYPPEYVEEGKPAVDFISSEHIRFSSEDAIVFISVKESEVQYELREQKIAMVPFKDQSLGGRLNFVETCENTFSPVLEAKIKKHVYHAFLHGIGFYKIIERLDKGSGPGYDFEFYPSDKDFIPCNDVGGEEMQGGINKSFLYPFVAFGNLALLQHSQHTAVNFTFSFPRMSEIVTPCQAEGCIDGKVDCETDEDVLKYGETKPCVYCSGQGYIAPQSPYKIYQKRYDPDQGIEGDNKHLSVPDVQYYTPDVAILDYSKQEWKDYLEQAETAVYIQQRIKTGNVEAAKSKEITRDDLYSFLSKVGQTYFSKVRFAVQALENYLNANPVQVTVNAPYSYAIITEGEAFTELQTLLESSVPVAIKGNRVESFIAKFVSASSPLKRFLDVLKLVDPLLYYSKDELTSYKITGIITGEQLSIHVFAYPILQQMYYADKNLFTQDVPLVADKLKKELEKYKPVPAQDLKTTIQGKLNAE